LPTLAIDTCLAACSAAVARADGEVVSHTEEIGIGHAERLPVLVRDLLRQAGVAPPTLERIVVTVGPGSFMGARVGISLAKGLAFASGAALSGFSTMEAMRLSHPGDAKGMVLIDARRDEVYAQAFDGPDFGEPGLLSVTAARDLLERDEPGLLIGSGVLPVLGREGALPAYPDPALMVRHADAATRAPTPLYLRAPDARPAGAGGRP
jgi:tRNA threonylcarbamoyladenosine biosynthesis protein TsaB